MAYFYQHIKGYNNNGTFFKLSFDPVNSAPPGTITSTAPTITTTSSGGTTYDFGSILTSNAQYNRVNYDFYFLSKAFFYTMYDSGIGSYRGEIGYDSNGIIMKGGSSSGSTCSLAMNASQFKMQGLQGQTQISFKTPNTYTTVTGSGANTTLSYTPIGFFIQRPDGTYGSNMLGFGIGCFDTNNSYTTWAAAGASTSTTEWQKAKVWANIPIVSEDFILSRNYIVTTGYMKAYSYIEGLYFNATSDIRAKKNVRQSTFSALDVIKQLPIYNFNYNTNDSASIGIIAQEAEDIDLDGFDIVNNKEASGEDGDYMTVKESKLVYITWKAIQEQQEIIEALKKEIEELKAKK